MYHAFISFRLHEKLGTSFAMATFFVYRVADSLFRSRALFTITVLLVIWEELWTARVCRKACIKQAEQMERDRRGLEALRAWADGRQAEAAETEEQNMRRSQREGREDKEKKDYSTLVGLRVEGMDVINVKDTIKEEHEEIKALTNSSEEELRNDEEVPPPYEVLQEHNLRIE